MMGGCSLRTGARSCTVTPVRACAMACTSQHVIARAHTDIVHKAGPSTHWQPSAAHLLRGHTAEFSDTLSRHNWGTMHNCNASQEANLTY